MFKNPLPKATFTFQLPNSYSIQKINIIFKSCHGPHSKPRWADAPRAVCRSCMVQENATVQKLHITVTPQFDEDVIEPHFLFLNFICARVRNASIGVFFNCNRHVAQRVRTSNMQCPVHSGETCSSFPHGWERSCHGLFQDAIPSFAQRISQAKMGFLKTRPSFKHIPGAYMQHQSERGTSHQSSFLGIHTIDSFRLKKSLMWILRPSVRDLVLAAKPY